MRISDWSSDVCSSDLPETAFFSSAGLVGPGHMFALLARRHMHLYGTTREHFAEVAIGTRAYALRHPDALMKVPLTAEAYFAAPMIAAPHCLFDFSSEERRLGKEGVSTCRSRWGA